jgi:hypothetical protein
VQFPQRLAQCLLLPQQLAQFLAGLRALGLLDLALDLAQFRLG